MGSIYIHIPFCASKCRYCDFFSSVGTKEQLDQYVDLLLLQLDLIASNNKPVNPCATIFFGGGTPSLLQPPQIARILEQIEQTIGIDARAEISLEANPGTVNQQQLTAYRELGINRLSLGIQSLNIDNLKFLGRTHSVKDSYAAIEAARAAGFNNLSLDYIFALPEQSLAALQQELTTLLRLAPEHISIYGLTIEPGTELGALYERGKLTVCDENIYADQYDLIHQCLTNADFNHYEISNFARPGMNCRHNQGYWQRKECIAIGAGGHSFYAKGEGERWFNRTDLNHYKKQLNQGNNPAELIEIFNRNSAMKEYAYLALRTNRGIDRATFQQKFALYPEEFFQAAIEKCGKYLQTDGKRYWFNLEGWKIYDHLISYFL